MVSFRALVSRKRVRRVVAETRRPKFVRGRTVSKCLQTFYDSSLGQRQPADECFLASQTVFPINKARVCPATGLSDSNQKSDETDFHLGLFRWSTVFIIIERGKRESYDSNFHLDSFAVYRDSLLLTVARKTLPGLHAKPLFSRIAPQPLNTNISHVSS
eukprot:scaffold8371_cov199-Amphora_coffeaeformis.AAC.5